MMLECNQSYAYTTTRYNLQTILTGSKYYPQNGSVLKSHTIEKHVLEKLSVHIVDLECALMNHHANGSNHSYLQRVPGLQIIYNQRSCQY